jgi:hypothetical protein
VGACRCCNGLARTAALVDAGAIRMVRACASTYPRAIFAGGIEQSGQVSGVVDFYLLLGYRLIEPALMPARTQPSVSTIVPVIDIHKTHSAMNFSIMFSMMECLKTPEKHPIELGLEGFSCRFRRQALRRERKAPSSVSQTGSFPSIEAWLRSSTAHSLCGSRLYVCASRDSRVRRLRLRLTEPA